MRRTILLCVVLGLLALSAPVLAAGGGDDHGDHGGDHVPTVDEINWFYGMLGEKDGVEPSLLWRPSGMPAPYGALLLNSAILYFILFRLFRKPVTEGLANRKANILRGMEEASRMKKEAEEQLATYEAKLAGLDEDIARIQREMRAAGENERARILSEARERRERMERDAHVLIEQELKGIRERLVRETLESAIASAERKLRDRLGASEQTALAEQYLTDVKQSAPALRGRV
jgi:F-type H+-transporting ATPase subunit b